MVAEDTFEGQVVLVVKTLLLETPNEALHEAAYTSVEPRTKVRLCGTVFPCHPPLLLLNMQGVAGEV